MRNRILVAIGIIAVFIGALFVFAPASIGGQMTYVTAAGESMSPTVQNGDLVLLRVSDQYQVGDIVGYRDLDDVIVIHRIVGFDGDRYSMKGDNNRDIDLFQPTAKDIVGNQVLRVPRLGAWIRQPWILPGSLAFALTAFLFLSIPVSTERRKHFGQSLRARLQVFSTQRELPASVELGWWGRLFILLLAAVLIGSLALLVISYAAPSQTEQAVNIPFEHSGTLTYGAQAGGTIYQDGQVDTGEPVYRQLVDQIEFRYGYQLTSMEQTTISGSYDSEAILNTPDGWSHVIELVPDTEFTGSAVTVVASLRFDDLQGVVDRLLEETGLSAGETAEYRLTIAPSVHVTGLVANASVDESFTPEFVFELDPLVFRQANASSSDGMEVIEESVAVGVAEVDNTLRLFGVEITVPAARRLAQLGIACGIILGIVLAYVIWSGGQQSEAERIANRHGSRIVSMVGSNVSLSRQLIEVSSIEDLVRASQLSGSMILHYQQGMRHYYFVAAGDKTYGYRTRKASTLATVEPPLTSGSEH